MHAWEFRYPDFKEGQVLTHNDLNLLRDFLYSRTAAHARLLFGFGVACGLEGSISGTNVSVSAGFALGQGGRELILEAPRTIAVSAATAASSLVTFPGVSATGVTGDAGYTAILRAADAVEPAGGDCDEDGCTTHTEIHTLTAEIVWARGRLGSTGLTSHAIFQLEPLAPTATATQFNALRSALNTHLTGRLEAPTLALLTGMSLESGSAAAARNLIRIGIVNEVLYTAWAFFRCEAYLGLSCLGVGAADPLQPGLPGVALGWLRPEGSGWAWERRYRHDFQLARALYSAVAATGGTDACNRYLDHIRVLLQEVEVPAPPSGGGTAPPDSGDVDICRVIDWATGRCGPWWHPEIFEELPYEVFLVDPTKLPPGPRPMPEDPDWGRINVLDELTKTDVLNVGLVRMKEFVNTRGLEAKTNLEQAIGDLGIEPKVEVVPVAELSSTTGFEPGLVVSAGDQIYFGVNAAGAVVSVGSVPSKNALADVAGVPAIAQAARDQAEFAVEEVGRLGGIAEGAQLAVEALQGNVVNLQQEWADFRVNLPREEVLDMAGTLVRDVERIDGRQTQFQRTLDRVQTQIESRFRRVESDFSRRVERLRSHVNTVDTELLGMVRENRHRVERQRVVVDRVDKEASVLRENVDELARATGQRIAEVGGRLDTQAIAIRTGMSVQDVARTQATNESLLLALDAIAKATSSAAGTAAAKKRVDRTLRQAEGYFEEIRRGTSATVGITEVAPQAVLGALEGVVMALEAAGATGPEFQDAQNSLRIVRRNLGIG